MEFIEGINFHSANDYKYLLSGDYRPYELDVDKHISELSSAQKYSYLLQPGLKFYFVYPIKTHIDNRQVFGSGEIVRSKQPGRETILVPFVQYFSIKLSESIKYNLNFEQFFQKFGRSYSEIFSNSNLTPRIVSDESIGNDVSSYSEIEECVGSRGSKIKKYVATLQEGLNILNNLMGSPNVVRWAYSAILTPLDEEYPENIVIVYGQTEKFQMKSMPSNIVQQLHSENQSDLLQRFLAYVIAEKRSSASDISVIDTTDLSEVEELLKEFIKTFSKRKLTKNELEGSHQALEISIQGLASKPTPTTQDLLSVDTKLASYEENLKRKAVPFLDKEDVARLDFSANDVSKCLANFSLDVLRYTKLSSTKLNEALTAKTQELTNNSSKYWDASRMVENAVPPQSDVKTIMNNIGFYTEQGVKTTTREISIASSFDKAEAEVEKFSRGVTLIIKSQYSSGYSVSEKFKNSFLSMEKLLVKLQESLDRFSDSPERYQEVEQKLIATVRDYFKAYLDYERINGELIPKIGYDEVMDALKMLIDAVERKRKKSFDAQKEKIDTQYNDLKDIVKSQKKPSSIFRI